MLNSLIRWCVKREIQFLSFLIKKLETVADQLSRREVETLTEEITRYWNAAAAADDLGDYMLCKQWTDRALELEARRKNSFPDIQPALADASVPVSV